MLGAVAGCSTEKAKWSNITYHNTTCHYNVWWNGNESLKSGIKKLNAAAQDDYTSLLPVEQLGTPDNARSINPEMDRAVEKGVKGIKKHSIFVDGKEHVPYIKRCYLLTAYATFYKQDYAATSNTADILVSQFPGTQESDEAAVLMARCMTRERRYTEAEATLDQLVHRLNENNFSEKEKEKLYLAMVEATVPQQKYKKAVEYIHLSISSTSSQRTKARLNFLLAQIYQEVGRKDVAAKYYHRVLSHSPEYVMEFNARLGEASCADLQHTNLPKLERQLNAMLHDRKNREYQDQIYFAMGEMYLGVKDAKRACDNYRLSVAHAKANPAQRAKSALKLGEVLYDIYEDYDQAQRYYDTVMQSISADHPSYASIKRRSDMLTELCSYTRVINRCDSLLAVAALPESERNALMQAKIDPLRAQEERARERELLAELSAERSAQQNTLKGDWYFYNSNTVEKGREGFRKNWGMRTLEDNWFLSNKASMGFFPSDEPSADVTEKADTASPRKKEGTMALTPGNNPNDPHSPAYYLAQLPTTQHQLDSIDSLLAPNLLNAGYIYYDGVRNIPLALECYHRLADNFASHTSAVQTFYMLYRIYDRQGNTPQANYYRDMVLMGFPDCDYANLIRDNEYYRELLRRDNIVEDAYAELYDQYQQRDYGAVVSLARQADELYAGHPLMSKFHFWQAKAEARRGQRDTAIAILENLLANTIRTDSIYPIAQAELNFLKIDSATRDMIHQRRETASKERKTMRETGKVAPEREQLPADDELPPAAQVYRQREGQPFYVILLVNDRRIKATELQYRLTDFNTQYYSSAAYRVNATLFNDTTQLLTIHRFKNQQAAMSYYNHLASPESPLRQYNEGDYTLFAISTQNYATFYNRKDPDAYALFFKKYLLK